MEKSPLKVYVDRLKNGHQEKISEELSSDFLDIQERELSFPHPVKLSGETYLSGDHLIIRLKIEAEAMVPCAICNELSPFPIVLNDFYLTEPVEKIKSHIFDYTQEIREAILLQVPPFAECHAGQCPEREVIKKYLKTV